MSLSGTNSSFQKYEEFLSIRNNINNNKEKSRLKSTNFTPPIGTNAIKNNKSNNRKRRKFAETFSIKNNNNILKTKIGRQNHLKLATKKKLLKFSSTNSINLKRRKNRNSLHNSVNNIKLEYNHNLDNSNNNNIFKTTVVQNERILPNKECQNKINNTKRKKRKEITKINNINIIKQLEGPINNNYNNQENISPRKRRRKNKQKELKINEQDNRLKNSNISSELKFIDGKKLDNYSDNYFPKVEKEDCMII